MRLSDQNVPIRLTEQTQLAAWERYKKARLPSEEILGIHTMEKLREAFISGMTTQYLLTERMLITCDDAAVANVMQSWKSDVEKTSLWLYKVEQSRAQEQGSKPS